MRKFLIQYTYKFQTKYYFPSFDLEQLDTFSSWGEDDFLTIYDIDEGDNPILIAHLSGVDIGPYGYQSSIVTYNVHGYYYRSNWDKKIISSSNNKMLVQFISDESYERPGFSAFIQYTPLQSNECEDWLDMNKRELKSPNHPNLYDNNISCNWLITVQHGYHLTLEFLAFEVSIYIISSTKYYTAFTNT